MSIVNAMGNIVNMDGSVLAGNRDDKRKAGFRFFKYLTDHFGDRPSNTTITIVGTNADLGSRENYERVAHFAAQGHIRAIEPVNTSLDGDTVFVFSNQEIKKFSHNSPDWPELNVDIVGNAAAKATRLSIYDACTTAETISCEQAFGGIVPAQRDYLTGKSGYK
jgi:L-aminopeptidase/D-esterase-like protein